jgi:hypothetical protein
MYFRVDKMSSIFDRIFNLADGMCGRYRKKTTQLADATIYYSYIKLLVIDMLKYC